MGYSFNCCGHGNITAKHKTTLEFAKDSQLSLKGDCIVGVKADFSLKEIKKFIKSLNNSKKITIIMETMKKDDNKIIEKINAEINSDFNSDKDIVIRKSGFKDYRTFAINADKAACDLSKELIKIISNKKQKITIIIY